MSGNTNSPPPATSGPPTTFTANEVFAWKFDADFLLLKAERELDRSMTEHFDLFFEHAFNLFVTTHAIADHLWHSKAKLAGKWRSDKDYIDWCKKQNDMVSLFI